MLIIKIKHLRIQNCKGKKKRKKRKKERKKKPGSSAKALLKLLSSVSMRLPIKLVLE